MDHRSGAGFHQIGNYAAVHITADVYAALRAIALGKGKEVQLTDAIQELIDDGYRVQAIRLLDTNIRVDIGAPETYWQALRLSYRHAVSRKETKR